MKMIVFVLLMIIAGCMNSGYQVHPGSVDAYDSQVADVLLQAKTFLETTKPSLTPSTEGLWSNLARAYDAAVPVYLAWHQVAKSGGSDQTQKKADLDQQLMDLNRALTA